MDSSDKKTKPIFQDETNWDKISLDIYKEIYSEAKIKYDDMLSQSESISSKSQILIVAIAGIAAWSANNIFTKQINIVVTLILIGLFVVDLFLLAWQFKPRKVPLKGTAPKVVLKDEIKLSGDINGDKYCDLQKDKLFYYYQLCRYQGKYDDLRVINGNRANRYRLTLILTFLLFIGVLISNFYFPPLVSKSSSSELPVPGPCK